MDPDFYPVFERLQQCPRGDQDVLLVDIGGGMGHDLEEFRTKNPKLPGRLVLQEWPEVITQITQNNPKIKITTYDVFTPRPIKGGSL